MKKEDYHKYHRELWGWLSENPARGKELAWKDDWPGWEDGMNMKESEYIGGYCFACQYDSKYGDGDCDLCPIKWGEPREDGEPLGCIDSSDSPFYLWEHATDPDERSRLAAIIRDLPWEDKA